MNKKILISILLIATFIMGGVIFDKKLNAQQNVLSQAFTPIPHSTHVLSTPLPSIKTQSPIRLLINNINVNAFIESVGQDSKGRMDIPKKSDNAAWYNLGVKPGEKGNAVIDGHFDKQDGSPAIFYDLIKLNLGDEIIVKDQASKEYKFKITKKASYEYNKFPIEEVFGQTDKTRLNLITCEGIWDQKSHNYSKRTVIYSELES